MLHFQERGQNKFSLTSQLEAVFGEMMLEQFEFFNGFGHGQIVPQIQKGY